MGWEMPGGETQVLKGYIAGRCGATGILCADCDVNVRKVRRKELREMESRKTAVVALRKEKNLRVLRG